MKEQNIEKSLHDKLLDARNEALKNQDVHQSIRAHGKVAGMNTFSWIHPQVDLLAKTIESLPFQLTWIGCTDQVTELAKNYPDVMQKISSVVVYDPNGRNAEISAMSELKTVLCIDDLYDGLSFIRLSKKEDVGLLFTSDLINWRERLNQFEMYISSIG